MMSCNRDSNCNSIANNYVSRKDSINSDLNSLSENINTIGESINNFEIPNDYIGNKVQEKLKNISLDLESNSNNITSFKSEVNSFVDSKVLEHRNHYQAWKKAQEDKEKAGDDDADS
jgi:hypothetical protein